MGLYHKGHSAHSKVCIAIGLPRALLPMARPRGSELKMLHSLIPAPCLMLHSAHRGALQFFPSGFSQPLLSVFLVEHLADLPAPETVWYSIPSWNILIVIQVNKHRLGNQIDGPSNPGSTPSLLHDFEESGLNFFEAQFSHLDRLFHSLPSVESSFVVRLK